MEQFKLELRRALEFVRQGERLLWGGLVLMGGCAMGISLFLAIFSAFPVEFTQSGEDIGLVVETPPHIKAADVATYFVGIFFVGLVATIVWLAWSLYAAFASRLVRGRAEEFLVVDALCHLPLVAAAWVSYRSPDSSASARPPAVDCDMVWYLQGERRRVRMAAPLAGTYPTSRWQNGEIVREETFLALPSDLPPGTYRLVLRLQRPDSGQWTRIWRFGFPTLSRKLDLGEITVLSGS